MQRRTLFCIAKEKCKDIYIKTPKPRDRSRTTATVQLATTRRNVPPPDLRPLKLCRYRDDRGVSGMMTSISILLELARANSTLCMCVCVCVCGNTHLMRDILYV